MISEGTGRVVPGLSMVPSHPVPVWAVTPRGTVLSGPADRYELVETDSLGRTIRAIRRAVPADRIPPVVRGDSLRALRRRIDSLPVPLSQVRGASQEVTAQRLPETFPLYRGVITTAENETWVRATTPAIAVRRGVVACMVIDPETGAESLVVAQLGS
jgi:hypothetical protein